ncbi:MAG: epimerase, partial [Anaerolineales bacterium]|nr:epimerase [Candidatus Desulfolinea nitratireducens]
AVTEIVPGKAEVIYNPRVSGGVSKMCADLTLAKKKLGYQPSVSLEEGLRLTLEKDPRFTE